MKSYKYRGNGIEFVLPDNWDIEESDNVISFFDSDNGVGALQFSFFQVRNEKNIVLKDELADLLDNQFSKEIIINNNCAEAFRLEENENKYWKYWLFLKEEFLIFASYNCQKDDKGKEDRIVNEIVYSVF